MNEAETSPGGFIDTAALPAIERKRGWRGRTFNSPSMTFVQYEFDAGASIHEHAHPQEEVWQILEGELEFSIGGETRRAGAGLIGIVRPDVQHSVRALTDGRAIVTDFPRRKMD